MSTNIVHDCYIKLEPIKLHESLGRKFPPCLYLYLLQYSYEMCNNYTEQLWYNKSHYHTKSMHNYTDIIGNLKSSSLREMTKRHLYFYSYVHSMDIATINDVAKVLEVDLIECTALTDLSKWI